MTSVDNGSKVLTIAAKFEHLEKKMDEQIILTRMQFIFKVFKIAIARNVHNK